ncbi:unnamed protein product [Diabrotica balteata]|uniref:Uncharacterized protein n=1 Tax=Diabrotica balteata TaxID=107213 RepID=A0A9N9SUX3_DIABA|nr:unnamed protein product [Diabrotica balteata]
MNVDVKDSTQVENVSRDLTLNIENISEAAENRHYNTDIEFKEPFEVSESSYHPNSSSDSEDEAIKSVNIERRNKAKAFLEKLPKMPSHYCRSSTSKLYLETTFQSYKEVHDVYKSYEPQSAVGYDVFSKEMTNTNIDVYHPRKDQCDLCFSHKLGNVKQEDYESHISQKNRARKEKIKDKEDALEGKVCVFTMDVQAVQLVPVVPAVCYVWHEGEGKTDANSFTSCVIDFLNEELDAQEKDKPKIFYCDGCSAQNRNVTLANALQHFCNENDTVITQKYTQKTYTVNPYKVKYIDHQLFNDYSEIKYYSFIRPGKKVGDACVNNLRALRYSRDLPVQFKLNFDEEWQFLPVRKNTNNAGIARKVYNDHLPITEDKFNHLQSLKTVIHPDYHAAVEMVHIMCGEREGAKFNTIPLSNNTIQRRISDMAEDIQAQVVENLNKCTYFSLQMDESTDISNCAQFITFTNTTGKCLLDTFVKCTSKYNIDWVKCIAICTDGAKAMTGHKSGLVVKLQEIMPNTKWRHCFLHREALASKALPPEMDCVMKIHH